MEKLVFMGIIASFCDILSIKYQLMSFKLTTQTYKASLNWAALCVFIAIIGSGISFSGCKTGYGCKANEAYKIKTDKNGDLSMKRGKTKLFDDKKSKKRRS